MKIIEKQSQVDKMYLMNNVDKNGNFNLNIITPAGIIVFETEKEIKEFLALIGESLFYTSKYYLSKLFKENKRNEN